jgi:hypothetical protein
MMDFSCCLESAGPPVAARNGPIAHAPDNQAYLPGVPKITTTRVNEDVRDAPLRVDGDKVHRSLTGCCAA